MASLFSALRVSSLRTASRSPVMVLPIPRHRLLSTLALCRNQRPQLDTRWRSARWNSSAAAASVSTTPPVPPTGEGLLLSSESLLGDPGALADTIAAIPPLQHGDLQALGLCHWTPAGLMQYSFELVHVLTGLPWFHTFIAATIFWRIVIFPFAVVGMRNSARLRPVTGDLNRKTEEIKAAQRIGDTVAMQRANLEAAKLRADAGVSMLGLVAPMIQIPISIGMFFGVKKMCELPVMQLTQSGFEWLPDLTQPGPYFILPILVAASGNVMMSMSARDMDPSRPQIGHFMNVIRVVTVLAIYWMNRFPSGLLLCLLVTSVSAVLQSAIFRAPALRTALKIPQWTPPPAGSPKLPTMRESIRYFIDSAKPGQQGQAPGAAATPGVRHYIPPTHPSASVAASAPLKSSARPVRPLEVVARQAQARASASPKSSSGGLFEDPEPPKPAPKLKQAAPAPPPTSKPKQAAPTPPPTSKPKQAAPAPTPKSTPPKSKAAKRPKS